MAYGRRSNRRRSVRRPVRRYKRKSFATRRPTRRTFRRRVRSTARFPFRKSNTRMRKIVTPRNPPKSITLTFREILFQVTPISAHTPSLVENTVYQDSRYVNQTADPSWAVQVAGNIKSFSSGRGHKPLTVGAGFSRLDDMAKNFDRYRINSAHVIYVPEVNTSQAGSVAISFEPNVLEAVTPNLEKMLQNEVSAQGPLWSSWSLPVPLGKRSKSTNSQWKNAPDRGCDFGQLFYLSTFVASGADPIPEQTKRLGTFWIQYSVTFSDPSSAKVIGQFAQDS